MRHLLDTSIVIDFLRGKESVMARFNWVVKEGLGLSTITLAELYQGALKSSNPKGNIAKIEELVSLPEVTLFLLDKDVALEYAILMNDLEKKGLKLLPFDVLIASTAKLNKLCVVSSDRHFFRFINFGLKVEIIS